MTEEKAKRKEEKINTNREAKKRRMERVGLNTLGQRIRMKEAEEAKKEVRIVDINMPFWSMVTFMIKASFATIPAAIGIIFGYLVILNMLRTLLVN